jgi:Zn-dependent protease with chaperone function
VATGEWSGGDVAALVPVDLEIDGACLVVRTADRATLLARWPVGTLRIDAMQEGPVAYIESTDDPGRTVSTGDEALLGALGAGGARRAGLPPRRRLQLALAFAASVVAIFGGLYAAMPWIARAIAVRVPFAVERRLEPGVEAMFASGTCRSADADAAFDAMRARLDPGRSVPADVSIVNVAVPNAFALPGGTILFTRGLLEEAKSGEEIAGVLAHEMAHVKLRHVLAALIQDTFMSGVWAVAFGDYSGLLVVDPRTMENLIELRHSRATEAEADRVGLETMKDARVSPAGLADFLDRNQAGAVEGYLSFLSTHPASADRSAMLRSVPVDPGPPVLTPEQLEALEHACDGAPKPRTLREIVGWPRDPQAPPSPSPVPSSPPSVASPVPSTLAK